MLQNIRMLLFDKKVLLGIGIGILISTLCIMLFSNNDMSKAEIEKKARTLGMKYASEMKVLE
ncbi:MULTISPECIES: flagellar protein [unclassified Clostridioides]|uniref:flagellar protein n=2 Tax=unclassified Clostridioides TaxID=2635829 RepID=UPI001D0FA9AF|nr:flagellar protein [Clostridioides sp. ZZV14-6150]MCC0661010.1 flagellar protein [Clostridioides sp. ZZV14-6154]MCC0668274.1 flagellar protein [Clostridioides sp. ZZV14-6153]MCC0718153.1 flagellar protein [Clostridioides sp. ZZV14-6105]MCC0722569.1 flagellar protein [Clostridioides sp. ZZV14-6104]MCC0727079.1 flagellar protein [Clostridioides sp. ZZV14-6045]MCC0729862.1 flagellar protein [Clostridioides sp. ZZV14-6048]MCC0734744.1 flagellar protein [Clostridioides sp. ZZV14-6009]MCC073825